MKITIVVVGVLTAMGCAGTVPMEPMFDESNAHLVRQSIEAISLVDSIAGLVRPDERVVLVPIDRPTNEDGPVSAMIDDILLRQLLNRGYTVLERDFDLMYRLMSESSSSYQHITQERTIQESTMSDASASGVKAPVRLEYTGTIQDETTLESADKLIAYRVVESGVLYKSNKKSSGAQSDSLTRVALTELAVRTEDAKSGEILNMFVVRGSVSDRVHRDQLPVLEDYHYRHYGFGYPNVSGNPGQVEYSIQSDKSTSGKAQINKSLIAIFAVVAGVAIMYGISASGQ